MKVPRWALVLGLIGAVAGQAHRLSVNWQVADGSLTLRAGAENDPAAGADVELRSDSGAVLATGMLDAQGQFCWPLSATGSVTVVVDAGLGHRRTLTLAEADLRRAAAAPSAPAAISRLGEPKSDRGGPAKAGGSSDEAVAPIVRVGLGLTFLVALAAAWMSYRNTRRLAALEQRLLEDESRG